MRILAYTFIGIELIILYIRVLFCTVSPEFSPAAALIALVMLYLHSEAKYVILMNILSDGSWCLFSILLTSIFLRSTILSRYNPGEDIDFDESITFLLLFNRKQQINGELKTKKYDKRVIKDLSFMRSNKSIDFALFLK